MKALIIQHVPFEGPASIEPFLQSGGYEITTARMFEEGIPASSGPWSLLIIMGGPMSVHDTADYPRLADEKKFIADALAKGIKTIGVCLGAQLIAEALGGYVTRNPEKEIGWHPVNVTGEGRNHPVMNGIPDEFTAFHWHGETFSVPDGAVRLAESSACANQAFIYGGTALALQFHFETTAESANLLIQNAASDMTPGKSVQSAEIITGLGKIHIPENTSNMKKIISNFIKI